MKMCDFCADMPREWRYPAKGVDWFACAQCSKFIEEENVPALVERCVQSYLNKFESARTLKQVTHHTIDICVEFQKHRTNRIRQPYDPRKEEPHG